MDLKEPWSNPWHDKLEHNLEETADGWVRLPGLNLNEAENLMDWLEIQGIENREIDLDEFGTFVVRWRKCR